MHSQNSHVSFFFAGAGVEMRPGVAGVRPFLEGKPGLHHASPGGYTKRRFEVAVVGRFPSPSEIARLCPITLKPLAALPSG